MPDTTPMLHMLCGKIAAGKSTLAGTLSREPGTVLVVEDDWLQALFGDQMSSGADFVRCSAKLRSIMGPHVSGLLSTGVSVVLDFQANTVESRVWMRGILDATAAAHTLHYLAPPDAVCLQRLRARNTAGEHAFEATEAQFHQFAKHFVPPSPDEGFNVLQHDTPGV